MVNDFDVSFEDENIVYVHYFPDLSLYVGITHWAAMRWSEHSYKSRKMDIKLRKFGWINCKHLVYAKNLPKDDALAVESNLIRTLSKSGFEILNHHDNPSFRNDEHFLCKHMWWLPQSAFIFTDGTDSRGDNYYTVERMILNGREAFVTGYEK